MQPKSPLQHEPSKAGSASRITALFVIAIAILGVLWEGAQLARSNIAIGKVIDLPGHLVHNRKHGSHTEYNVVAAYNDTAGLRHVYRSSWSSSNPGYTVGDPIRLYYPRNLPDDSGLCSLGTSVGYPLAALWAGIVLLVGNALWNRGRDRFEGQVRDAAAALPAVPHRPSIDPPSWVTWILPFLVGLILPAPILLFFDVGVDPTLLVILLMVGAALSIGGYAFGMARMRRFARHAITIGTVTGVRVWRGNKGSILHFLKLAYTDGHGHPYTCESTGYSQHPGYGSGDTVRVSYDPERPRQARLCTFSDWFDAAFSLTWAGMWLLTATLWWVLAADLFPVVYHATPPDPTVESPP